LKCAVIFVFGSRRNMGKEKDEDFSRYNGNNNIDDERGYQVSTEYSDYF
jgi:hypothetical protein